MPGAVGGPGLLSCRRGESREPPRVADPRLSASTPDTVQVLRDHRKRRAEERLRLDPEWRGTGDYVFSIALGRADPPRHGVIAYDHAHVISDQLTWAADIFAQAVAATS